MNKNTRLFNAYIFLTTFARSLLEVFIGTFLYKIGFSIQEVLLYYVLVMGFSTIITTPCFYICKRYSNKLLSVIGIITLFVLQLVLDTITKKTYYLYIIALLYAIYRRSYWIARRYYTLQVIDDKSNISKKYSFVSIANQLGAIIASYIGALLLQNFSLSIINNISFILLGISVFILYKLDLKQEKNDAKLDLIGTLKNIPISSIIGISCYSLLVVITNLFSLFIIIYVKDTYTAVGLISVLTSISSLVFTYIYGRLINKNKNYLKLSILLYVILQALRINTQGIMLIIVTILIGFVSKMYEQSFQKEHILLSKNFELNNYNYAFETIQNIVRLILMIFLCIFISDVKIMLYITLIFISISGFVTFSTKQKTHNKSN